MTIGVVSPEYQSSERVQHEAREVGAVWFSKGANRTGLTDPTNLQHVKNHAEGLTADGKRCLRRQKNHTPELIGDIWGLSKSVNSWASQLPPEQLREFAKGLVECNAVGNAYLEQHCGYQRRGAGGKRLEKAELVTYACVHVMAANGQPFLHVHNFHQKYCVNSEGQTRRNADDRKFFQCKVEADLRRSLMLANLLETRCGVKVAIENGRVEIPTMDVVVQPKELRPSKLPIFIECKSAGDFTNVNKRRKEEAKKASQLFSTYGKSVEFILFLCGYFDQNYLEYEKSDGMDWVWEHRPEDLDHLEL